MAPLSLSRVDVQTATDRFERVSLIIRNDVAKLRDGREIVAEAEVSGVEQTGRRTYDVTLADGSTWAVVRSSGCGCG